MPLFEFELAPVEDVAPWGEAENLSLSWFALTDGRFHLNAGSHVLFRYTPAILAHWNGGTRDAEYQVAALARDFLGTAAAAVAPLPNAVEQLARNWDELERLREACESGDDADESDAAWRWLGERSPWTSYLVQSPRIVLVRIGDDVRIHWDNRACVVDGIQVWEAVKGFHAIAVEEFLRECRDFARRLVEAMDERIRAIELGTVRTQVPVAVTSLREQHEIWRAEFESYFREYTPDIPWVKAESALGALAARAAAG
jgi:hypothetical protein